MSDRSLAASRMTRVGKALGLYGPPVYVRKQIVHNLHVVRDLEARGAVFVEDENDVPEGETVVFSAHGIAPSVRVNAAARNLSPIAHIACHDSQRYYRFARWRARNLRRDNWWTTGQ